MSGDFETKSEQQALDYIRIHLKEGYYVSAYMDKGAYYWEDVYKIHAFKKSDAVCKSKWKKPCLCGKRADCIIIDKSLCEEQNKESE